MTITEENRYHLYQHLEVLLGTQDATTLMEHLPPVGWADVATRRDLDQQGVLLRGEITQLGTELRGEMKHGFAEVRVEFHRELRTAMFAVLGANAATAGLVFAAARLM